jgi:hypothetical protein
MPTYDIPEVLVKAVHLPVNERKDILIQFSKDVELPAAVTIEGLVQEYEKVSSVETQRPNVSTRAFESH